jgi:N utilization substance protein A
MGSFKIHQFVGDELPIEAIVLREEDPDAEVVEPESGAEEDEEEIDFDIDWTHVPASDVETIEVSPQHSFGRIAAQTAKQVILQRIREAERGIMYEEYIDRVGELVNGTVQSQERGVTIVELGRAEAILPGSEGIPGERHDHGARIKAVILEVRSGTKGPQIVLSRGSDEMIRRLFELEVPEVADGLVELRAVAREPGYRSKIAVESKVQGVDPVGACVGPRGSRVRMVVSELRGEKIDIIPFNDEPARYIAKALSPARVREVVVDDDDRQATVIVPDDQLALAIGREGQNARLASRLTGWAIDIRGASEYAGEESEGGREGGADVGGRCKAIMKNDKRCPNMAIEGSEYCALPHHQALIGTEGATVAVDDDEVATTQTNGTDVTADAGAEETAEPTAVPAGDVEAEDNADGETE